MYKYLASTVFTGKKVVYLPTCHSTNAIARELIQNRQAQEGAIIITDHQTAGKGQRGNTWEAKAGENLTLSIIYHPRFLLAEEAFDLNIITSLAIWEAMKGYGIQVLIKWPNDIYAGNKKLGGILIENMLVGKKLNFSVIGIGLNINQQAFENPNAISTSNITGRNYKLENVLTVVATHLEQFYLQLKSGRRDTIRNLYFSNLMGLNELRDFEVGGSNVKGIIKGIDSRGRLKVEINEKMMYFSFKEIQFLF